MKKAIVATLFIIMLLSMTGCGNNTELEALREENEELKQQISTSSTPTSTAVPKKEAIIAKWQDNGTPFEYETTGQKLIIKDTVKVIKNVNEYILTMDFHYQNKTDNPMNFINDSYVSVRPFQNGIELDTASPISRQGVYDMKNAFTSIKDGAEIDAQLAYVLQDISAPVEVTIGHYSDKTKQINKVIEIIK